MHAKLCTVAAACILSMGTVGVAAQQPVADKSRMLASADSAFLNGAFQLAADTYAQVVKRDSTADVAWFRLGLAFERLSRMGDARIAFAHATRFPAQLPGAEFALARVLARQNETDSAFAHLRNAASAGVDPAVLDQAPALASLRTLAPFGEIRKLAEDKRFPCRSVHTFDFWAGDFDAYPWSQAGGRSGGQLHNTRDYEGCLLVEHWIPVPGGGPAGTSTSFYDTARKTWRFIWIDDGNGSIDLTGGFHDGAMRFEGVTTHLDGTTSLVRNVLQEISADVVRHTFSVSNDGGKTWTVQGDDRFVRRHQ